MFGELVLTDLSDLTSTWSLVLRFPWIWDGGDSLNYNDKPGGLTHCPCPVWEQHMLSVFDVEEEWLKHAMQAVGLTMRWHFMRLGYVCWYHPSSTAERFAIIPSDSDNLQGKLN